MSDSNKTQSSFSNLLLSVLGGLGAFLIFGIVVFVAYLPNRPDPVDSETHAKRQIAADESRAQGIAKLGNLDVAMEATVNSFLKD